MSPFTKMLESYITEDGLYTIETVHIEGCDDTFVIKTEDVDFDINFDLDEYIITMAGDEKSFLEQMSDATEDFFTDEEVITTRQDTHEPELYDALAAVNVVQRGPLKF